MGNLVVLDRHLWLTLTELKDSEKTALLDTPMNPSGLFGAAVETFTERFVEAQKQSKAINHFLPKRASAKPPARSCSSSAQRAGRPHAPSAAVQHEHEPAVRSSQPWLKRHQGSKGKRPRPDRNGRPPAPESKPRSWCSLSEEETCTQRRRLATEEVCSLRCVCSPRPPACCGWREQLSCLCFDCSTMQCNKIEKHTKLTSISGQFSSSHSPLPNHSLSHSCGIKLPAPQRQVIPHGVQSASPAVTVHRSVAGTARGIRVGYEINKEWLHASVLPQTAPFQRCVNVHCTARGNTQSSRKAHYRDSAPHRPRERLLQSLFSGAKERRRTPPNLGTETAESRAFKVLIQNDYAETNPLTHKTRRLVYLRGFKGCLFSHSGSPPATGASWDLHSRR